MASLGSKLIPLNGLNLDVAPQYLKETQARFIKNLYYQLSDLGEAGTNEGANTGVLKPLPSNEIYCPIDLPEGDNHVIGTLSSTETKELYACVYNSESNHCIFRVNGLLATGEIVKIDPCFNFQLDPKYFIGEGQSHLEIIYLTDPDTDEQVIKKDFYWTDGFNPQGYLRIDDSIATDGFNPELYPYFQGNYNKCALVRMGLPTPDNCIEIDQVPFDEADISKNNNLKFDSWQFRVSDIDVFGRPSEHGMISDLYYIASNGCLDSSDALSRCVNLTFDAGNPFVDKKQIEYRNCNDTQWYLDSVIDLYEGSNLGKWWERIRNPKVNYDPNTNKITYTFCKDKLCDPISPDETNRTQPEVPRTSQALTKIGKEIALANNKEGFQPLSKKDVLDKISLKVTNAASGSIGESANITIYIRIYNPLRGSYQQVYKKGDDYVFGGIVSSSANKSIDNIKTDYQQYFAVKDQKGFIGYLIGTENYAVGVQYYLDENNNFIKDEDFVVNHGRQYFLKYEFNGVPKNSYRFTLASHLSDPSTGDIRDTSTYVGGIYDFSNLTVGSKITDTKELKVDVCDGDYNTLDKGEMLLTFDLTHPLGGAGSSRHSDSTVLDGYVYESTNTDGENKTPVELLQLSLNSYGNPVVSSVMTDRNGFYFVATYGDNASNPLRTEMIGYCGCVKKILATFRFQASFERFVKNMILGAPSQDDVITLCQDYDINPCSRMLIKGRVNICDSDTGVPNVNVVLARGGLATTDANGNFTLIAHDDVINSFRKDDLYIVGGSCSFVSCDGQCLEVKEVSFAPCVSCTERITEISSFEVLFVSNRGLLSGGRYITEITAYDWLGRHGFAQTGDNFEFTVPSLNETKSFGFPTVNMIVPPDVTFPDWVDYVTVGISIELNYGTQYIDWIADKVTFVDNSGEENTTAPTQIRIDYSSLNEYNAKNNFNTTTGWQITPTDSDSPRVSDVVQFIRNGDGVFFDNPITALIKYDQQGQYFLINYTDSLKDLKANALIRIANPTDCANKDVFFELCGKYKVINGKIQQNNILLNAFDTYYQYRQIPVPVTTGDDNDTTIIELRQFGFPFEHHSVTDLWGYKCSNKGRINVKNPYESEILHIDQIALSGALSVNAQLNYLNYFSNDNKTDIQINNSGGIVYVRYKTGMVFVVCQYVNFLMGFNDNIPRVNAQGQLIIPSAADKFGKPERSTTGNYGCQFFDKSTIREKIGLVQWLDRNMVAILQNNFQSTVDISRYNPSNSTIASWLVQKIKYQQQYNVDNGNKRYFHAVINPSNFEWVLSEFTIGGGSFVNGEREIVVEQQETISFDIIAKVWKSFYSFTPEYFSYLEGANSGQLLFSFNKGVPYSHSVINQDSWNKFFGIKCGRVYDFIYNTDGFKKKKFQSMSVYCPESLYWSDLIITENKQKSRLLKSWWNKHLYFWSANFLCDTNKVSVNNILDSDNLEGSWIRVRLIGDPDEEYSELYGVEVFAEGQGQSS